jgi:hypothetical protein
MDGDGDHTFASQGHERASLGGAQVLGRETQVLPWDTFFKAYRTTHFSALNERVSCGWVGGRHLIDCRKKAFRQGRHDHRMCSHSSNCKV